MGLLVQDRTLHAWIGGAATAACCALRDLLVAVHPPPDAACYALGNLPGGCAPGAATHARLHAHALKYTADDVV